MNIFISAGKCFDFIGKRLHSLCKRLSKQFYKGVTVNFSLYICLFMYFCKHHKGLVYDSKCPCLNGKHLYFVICLSIYVFKIANIVGVGKS